MPASSRLLAFSSTACRSASTSSSLSTAGVRTPLPEQLSAAEPNPCMRGGGRELLHVRPSAAPASPVAAPTPDSKARRASSNCPATIDDIEMRVPPAHYGQPWEKRTVPGGPGGRETHGNGASHQPQMLQRSSSMAGDVAGGKGLITCCACLPLGEPTLKGFLSIMGYCRRHDIQAGHRTGRNTTRGGRRPPRGASRRLRLCRGRRRRRPLLLHGLVVSKHLCSP